MSLIPNEYNSSCSLTYDPWDSTSSIETKLTCFCQQTVRNGQLKFLLIDDIDELTDAEQICISQCYDSYRGNVRIIASSSAFYNIIPELQHRLEKVNVRYPSRRYMHRLVRNAWEGEHPLSAASIDSVLDTAQNSLHAVYASLDKLFLLDTPLSADYVSRALVMIEEEKVERLLVAATAGKQLEALGHIKTLLDSGVCPQDIIACVGGFIEKSNNSVWRGALASAVLFFARTRSASGAVYHLALTLFPTGNAK